MRTAGFESGRSKRRSCSWTVVYRFKETNAGAVIRKTSGEITGGYQLQALRNHLWVIDGIVKQAA